MSDFNMEFEDIGQTSLDMEIDLETGDIGGEVIDVTGQQGFEYPAMLITGIKFNDTLRVLKALRRKTFRLFDTWVDLEDGNPPVKQGSMPADSSVFLAMRTLGLHVTLYLDENTVMPLDLQDPECIMEFI